MSICILDLPKEMAQFIRSDNGKQIIMLAHLNGQKTFNYGRKSYNVLDLVSNIKLNSQSNITP